MDNVVWVTQERQGFNYTDAERFGDLVFITHLDYTLPTNSSGNERIKDAITRSAMQFKPDDDMILLSGSPVVAGVFIGEVVAKHRPRQLRIVKWDNRESQYNVMNINV